MAAAEETGFLALRDSQQEGTPVWPYLREFALIARSRSHLYLNPLRVAGFRRRPRFKAQLAPVADHDHEVVFRPPAARDVFAAVRPVRGERPIAWSSLSSTGEVDNDR
ncbi:hypothetical protein [Amycolatopsis japonica]